MDGVIRLNFRKWTLVLTCIGLVIWFVHRETGLDALPRMDKIEQLQAAHAHTVFENGDYLESIKIIYFEEEKLEELETIVKGLKIRRETPLNRLNKEATGEYALHIVTGGKEYQLRIEDTNRILVHTDRTYIIQDDALVDFLKERFSSNEVDYIGDRQ